MRRRLIIAMSLGVVVLGAVTAGLRSLPLSWVLNTAAPEDMKADLRVGGTVWDGYVAHPALDSSGGIVQLGSSAATLMTGGSFLSFNTVGSPFTARGKVGFGTAKDVKFTSPINAFAGREPQLARLAGSVSFELDSLEFDTGCIAASGTARTNILSVNGAAFDWVGPELSGPIRCDAGDLIIALSGLTGAENVTAQLRLQASGLYMLDASVTTSDNRAGAVLPLYGFENVGGTYRLKQQGSWR